MRSVNFSPIEASLFSVPHILRDNYVLDIRNLPVPPPCGTIQSLIVQLKLFHHNKVHFCTFRKCIYPLTLVAALVKTFLLSFVFWNFPCAVFESEVSVL